MSDALDALKKRLREGGHPRISSQEWRDVLIADEDTIIVRGSIYKILATSLGSGVVELRYEERRGRT